MRRKFVLSMVAGDLIALAVSIGAAAFFVFDTVLPWHVRLLPGQNLWPLIGLIGSGFVLGSYAGVRMWSKGIPRPSYGRAFAIWTFTLAFTALGIVVARVYWSRAFIAVTFAVWLVGMLGFRYTLRRRPWFERMVVITAEKDLAEDLADAPHADVLAVLPPDGEPPGEAIAEGVTVVVDLRGVLSDDMARWVSSLNVAGFPIRGLVSAYEEHTGRLTLVHLAEGWEIAAVASRNAWYAPIKSAIDVVLVAVTAPLWLVLAGMIAVAVRLDSPGPVIYRQERVGFNGAPFTIYKFRTMYDGADDGGPKFAADDDPRLTRVGRVLRRFHIDEIPQLWNVLRRDLSLVGPRPEQVPFADRFANTIPFYAYRHLVRPGVTGWAQVNYGYADDEAETVEKLTYDLYYIKHMSPWLDLQILGQSLWTVLSGNGAR